MPYSRSSAKKVFDTRIGDLSRHARYTAYKNKRMKGEIRDLVFQSVVFHLSAALEDYLANLIGSWIHQVTLRKMNSSALPAISRSYVIFHRQKAHYSNFVSTNDETKILKRLSLTNEEYKLVDEDVEIPNIITPSVILHERKYPSGDNIKVLFNRIGLSNIFDLLSKRLKTDAELGLRSFSDIRTSIAHESPPNLSMSDVENQIGFIKGMAAAIDRLMCSHVRKHSGKDCWT
jgi:hypothetical protein